MIQKLNKMKTKNRLTLLISFLLFSGSVFSQGISSSTTDSTIYLFPQFTEGSVTLKDGSVWFGKLNYNTVLDQMEFIGTNNEILSLAEPEKVLKVIIDNRNFINIKINFAEIISDGPVFLCQRKHTIRNVEKIGAYGTTGSGSNISTVSSFRVNERDVNDLMVQEKTKSHTNLIFYVINKRTIREIANQKDLLKCFPSKKELVKQELEKQHTKFSSVESLERIINWINEKGIKD